MCSHLWSLALIHTLRALGGPAFAAVLVYYSEPSRIPRNPANPFTSRYDNLEPGDPAAFLAAGIALAGLQLLRLSHGLTGIVVLVSRRLGSRAAWHRWSRRLGLGLAWLDLVDLTLFPVTTACGLYGLQTYRHPDTLDFFEQRFSRGAKEET